MNLSRKIILLIICTFIALIFIVAVTSDVILLNSFADLEKKVLNDDVTKVANEIEESFPELDSAAKDYVNLFQLGVDKKIANLNINSFATHRIDFVVCYDRTGNIVAVRSADFHKQHHTELTIAERGDLQQAINYITHQGVDGSLHGYIALGGRVVQLAIRSFERERYILVGKYIDDEEVDRVSDLTKFAIAVSPVSAAGVATGFELPLARLAKSGKFYSDINDDTHISGYSLFNDLYGKPVLIFKVTELRQIYEQGKKSIIYILIALIVSGVVFCSVMLFFIRFSVLKRLASLSSTVGDISRHGDISERLEIKGEDELEKLAGSINSMLESLESAEHALKESEERYRALFERAPDSIIIIGAEGDEKGRIVAANRAAALQHGYTVKELCSLTIHDLNTPETDRGAGEYMEKIVNGDWITTELWHVRKDGSQFPIEIHAGLIKLGKCNYILGFDRDITSRKLAEESDRLYLEQISLLNSELGHKASELAVANKELEAFNYSVTHDMRGPLTRISGYCQLMLDDDSRIDSQARTYLVRIYESCCWLDEMLEGMLKLSRLVQTDFIPNEVNLSKIVDDALCDLIDAEPKRAIDVVIAPDVMVVGDVRLLKILMSNLINNAWKYSSMTKRTSIEFGVMNEGAQAVYFVRDNGAGFNMKDADKLFRVFSRLHDHTQFSGSGIGLATVQRVIVRHGGKVWAESEIGHGATFYFTLAPNVFDV